MREIIQQLWFLIAGSSGVGCILLTLFSLANNGDKRFYLLLIGVIQIISAALVLSKDKNED